MTKKIDNRSSTHSFKQQHIKIIFLQTKLFLFVINDLAEFYSFL